MKSSEWIYINSIDNSIRYVLGTKGKKTLFCFGINPSTAEPNELDNTLEKVQKIALNNGYDSWLMLNVYPKRDTDFTKLSNLRNDAAHIENIRIIKNILPEKGVNDVWAAFGDHIFERNYLCSCWKDIYNEINSNSVRWLYTNKNKSGSPKHPLYQKDLSKLISFDMDEFLINDKFNKHLLR